MGALVLSLLAWISAATGYPMPGTPPTVQFVGHQFIRDTMCGGEECAVGAMYRRGGNVVYMDDRLDPRTNVLDSAVLLHELVHFEQEQSGRFPGQGCRTWVA